MSVFFLTTLYKTPAGGTINVNISRYMFLFLFRLSQVFTFKSKYKAEAVINSFK